MLALLATVVMLALGPYEGPPLTGSVPGTAKFELVVTGPPGRLVHVRARDVPRGYVASFCTERVCAPFAVDIALPHSGRSAIELQLIANEPGARAPRRVVVDADGGAVRATIAFARATR